MMADEFAINAGSRSHRHELGQLLAGGVDILFPCEREVLQGRFGLHDTEPEALDVLGERLGLTPGRVRRTRAAALLKLKHHLAREGASKEALS